MSRPKSLPKSLPGLWRITRYFWPHLRQYRGLMTVSFVALLAEVALRLLEPWPLKFVFDYIIGQRRTPKKPLPDFLTAYDPMTLLTFAALAVVTVTCLRAVVSYWETIGFAKLGNRALTKVRNQLYRHVQYLSLSFHTQAKTGDLVVRLIGDVGMLQDVAVTALLPMLAKVLIVTGMIGLMFWMNWQLAVIAVAVFPLFWLRTITLSERMREVAQRQRRQEGAMAASVAESISAIRTVQALSLEERFSEDFSATSNKTSLSDVKGKRLSAALERTVDVLVALATALVLWFGTRMVLAREVSAGELLVFLAYLKSAYRPVQDFAKYTSRLGKASAAGERVIDLLERVPDVRDLPGAIRAPAFRGGVTFYNVSFAYRADQHLLKDINFEAKPGMHVALVGPSGGGKTTMFSLILRLYDPQQGGVKIDGRDVREFTLESLRAQISVVLQDNVLFAKSVKDNIAYGAQGASAEEIQAAAKMANAHDFILELPQGYDTVLGERGVTLSHGQRQRIAIARAAIRKAPILILDEPMTGLDRKNEREVLDALKGLYGQRTTFLITHDPHHAAVADKILYLEEGCIVEHGTHAELMALDGRYAALHRVRAAERTLDPPGPCALTVANRPMKILYLCPDLGIPVLGRKGAAVHVRELIGAFARAGHRVTLAAQTLTKSPGDEPAKVSARVIQVPANPAAATAAQSLRDFNERLGVENSLPGELRRILYNRQLARGLKRWFIRNRPAFIYERASLYATAGARLAKKFNVPHIVELNAPLAVEQSAYRATGFGELAAQAERWTLTHADAVIVVSTELRKHVLSLGVKPGRIRVMPNGVNPQLFFPAVGSAHGVTRPALGFVGGLRPWHGVEILPALLTRLSKRYPHIRMIIAGDGQLREELERGFRQRGLTRRVRFTGALSHEDLPEVIRQFDIALAPYPRHDHDFYFSPLKLFEYMACGVAVVASDVGQISEVVTDGKTGLLYPPGEFNALLSRCEQLLTNPKLRTDIGNAAAKLVRRKFTWDNNASRVLNLARRLKASRRK